MHTIAFNIGYNKPLDQDEINNIAQFITEQFKTVDISRFKEAFDLYTAQKLGFTDSHFQSLDLAFIAKVLNSYKEWRRERARDQAIKQLDHSEEKKAIARGNTAPIHWAFMMKCIKEERIFPRLADWDLLYHHGIEIGYFEEPSIEEKKRLAAVIQRQMKHEGLGQTRKKEEVETDESGKIQAFKTVEQFLPQKAVLQARCKKAYLQRILIKEFPYLEE